MSEGHIVKAYDEELAQLDSMVSEMGTLVREQLKNVLKAMAENDVKSAKDIIKLDKVIDRYEAEIDKHATEMLALRQPMAQDLRLIVAVLKLAGNLERMGDYSKNIAKRTITLTQVPLNDTAKASLAEMGGMVCDMIADVIQAYETRDSKLALEIIARDQNVDRVHTGLFQNFMEMMTEDPQNVSAGTHLVFMAKNVERIGDHATNVAEKVYYMLEGEQAEEKRPKDDQSSKIVLEST